MPLQVLYLAAVVTSSQDLAFVLAIAWSALNLLMSGFQIRWGAKAGHVRGACMASRASGLVMMHEVPSTVTVEAMPLSLACNSQTGPAYSQFTGVRGRKW